MAVSSEQEAAGPSLMDALSRQRRRVMLQALGWDNVDLGTIICIPNPINQKDRACASVKMIL